MIDSYVMNERRFPHGWDEDRVKRLIAHYDSLTEEERVAEDEVARRRDEMRNPSIGLSHEEVWRRIDKRDG